MDLGDWLAAIGGILGLAGVAGAALAVLLSTRQRETTRILREDNGDLRNRMLTLEQSEQECEKRLAVVERENTVLREVVTGAQAIATLTKALADHDREVTVFWQGVQNRLDQVITEVRK